MKERWNRIRLGVWITAFAAAGVLEYIQLMYSFDLPQIILLMPLIGALCFIVLQKAGFIALAGTAVLSCLFQVLAGDTNVVMKLSLNASDVLHVILYVLPVCLIFELLGIGAGALIRICIKYKCKTAHKHNLSFSWPASCSRTVYSTLPQSPVSNTGESTVKPLCGRTLYGLCDKQKKYVL